MERMDRDMPFLLQYEHVAWFEKGKVRILDRRVYPTEVRFVVCTDYHEVVQAIADMVTQSAGPYTAVGMGIAVFSALLLVISVISKMVGCGLGAKLCGFSGKESVQVGVGMVCRGEVALIVANRGLSMGVLSQDLMTPVIITVVGGTILTPVLLKLAFRGEKETPMEESGLIDRYEKVEQLDLVSDQLLRKDQELMDKGNS